MAFEKKTWQFNDLITEHELNRIEDGIHEVHEELTPNQKAPLSLKVGIQAVNVLSNSALNVQFEGRTVVNHAPPFTSREWGGSAQQYITNLSDTEVEIDNTTSNDINYRFYSNVKGNLAYTINAHIEGNGLIVTTEYDENDNILGSHQITDFPYTFTTHADTKYLLFQCSTNSNSTAIFRTLSFNEGTEPLPYVRGVQNTRNPYVIAKGKNLLPSFTSGKWQLHQNAKVISPYELELNADGIAQSSNLYIPVIPNTTYTLSYETNQVDVAYINVGWYDENDNLISWTEQYKEVNTFTSPENAVKARVVVTNTGTGAFIFKNLQLELGDTATEFEPYEETYLFGKDVVLAEGERAYQNADGEWRKWQEWEQVGLDGSLNWGGVVSYTGFKRVAVTSLVPAKPSPYQAIGVKYDGKILPSSYTGDYPDLIDLQNTNGNFLVSISNQDSGWGDAYTPTPEEIKAYFMGWQMNNGTFGQPYNGTGTKTWVPLGDTDNSRATTTLPTSVSPTITEGKITHYQLHYKLAQPREVPVAFEGSLRVREGLNQIEVGTGVVVRERARPTFANNKWYINTHSGAINNLLENRPEKIVSIYKNTEKDSRWRITNFPQIDWAIFGKQGANIENSDYDPTAAYHVTYFVLDKHLFTAGLGGAQAEYNTNLATRLEENEKELIAQVRKVSALENELFPLLQGEVVDHNLHVKNPPLGYYVRYANGLQVCWGEYIGDFDVTTTAGSLFVSDRPLLLFYPATFINAPSVSISLSGSTTQTGSIFWIASDWDNNDRSFYKAYLLSYSSRTPSGLIMRLFAIGRWK